MLLATRAAALPIAFSYDNRQYAFHWCLGLSSLPPFPPLVESARYTRVTRTHRAVSPLCCRCCCRRQPRLNSILFPGTISGGRRDATMMVLRRECISPFLSPPRIAAPHCGRQRFAGGAACYPPRHPGAAPTFYSPDGALLGYTIPSLPRVLPLLLCLHAPFTRIVAQISSLGSSPSSTHWPLVRPHLFQSL